MNSNGPHAFAITALILSATALPAQSTNPCSGVDRTLSTDRIRTLEPAVAKKLGVKHAEISQSLRLGGWSILYVSTGEFDDEYLFYSADPFRSKSVTAWGGVALQDEEGEILEWTLKNAPGIPPKLARCFAWHVTNEP